MGKIVAIRVNKEPIIEDMDITHINMNNFVGGYLEALRLPNDITLWLNEEGKLIDLEPNLILLLNGKPYDYVCGNVFFCGVDDEGNSIGLTRIQAEEIYDRIRIGKKDGEPIFALEMG